MISAGFDIGGTSTRFAVFDEDWQCLHQETRPTRPMKDPQALAGGMLSMLSQWEGRRVNALGVGIAGQLSADATIVRNAPNLAWRDIPFHQLLQNTLAEAQISCGIRLVNDVNAILVGERACGAVQNVADVLAIFVGTGIGAALFANNALVEGATGLAGEIGHSKVVIGGDLCGCGQRGCIEAYAGGVHLEKKAAGIAKTLGLEVFRSDGSLDLAQADAASEEGEPFYELFEDASVMLAMVIANAATLLNPSVLLLGGGVFENLPNFRRRLMLKLPPLVLQAASTELQIRTPVLGELAGMIGAAQLAVQTQMAYELRKE